MFAWCKKCVAMRQFLAKYDNPILKCELCGNER